MIWQPKALPRTIGYAKRQRSPAANSRVQPVALPIGKLVHLGGATGTVFIEARLAQTSTATIYAVASQAYRGRHVLKCIDLRQVSRADVLREVSLQRQAGGPFVIDVQPPTFWPTQAFILLERGMGGTMEDALCDALATRTPIATGVLLRWFSDMAHGLQQCHVRGIVHQDIKPDNLVLTGSIHRDKMRVKLTDFGLATTFRDPPHAVGTITYMAPEVLRNTGATAAADLWSLGVTLFRMFVGIEPYYDETPETMALRLLRDTPQFTIQDLEDSLLMRGVGREAGAQILFMAQNLLQPDVSKRLHLSELLELISTLNTLELRR